MLSILGNRMSTYDFGLMNKLIVFWLINLILLSKYNIWVYILTYYSKALVDFYYFKDSYKCFYYI